MRYEKIFLCVVLILFAATMSGCANKPNSRAGEFGWKMYKEARNRFIEEALGMFFSNDENWIQDENSGVYIWNPDPIDGESVEWRGHAVRDGDKLYAHGYGMVIWHLNGEAVQGDIGYFYNGKQHGNFKHILSNNRVFYTDWDHGKRL